MATEQTQKMVTVTAKAAEKIIEFMKEEAESPEYLRVYVQGGGCSGFEYQFFFTNKDAYKPDTFTKYEQDGIVIIIDKKSDLYIEGTTLDWYDDLTQRGFKFDNPNAQKTCGCGSSFQV